MKTTKSELYRKVNTKARGCHHDKGSNFRVERNKRNPSEKMKQGKQRGLDYTPLFKFLLSKIGEDFDEVYSEAVSRLDKVEPFFWMVRTKDQLSRFSSEGDTFRVENAIYNVLFVDENNKLQKINPNLTINDIAPCCTCCTHSFNGNPIPNKK